MAAATEAWTPYTPDAKRPWDLRRVVHLHRRAGFGATWRELQRDIADGPERSIDRVINGAAGSQGGLDDFDRIAGLLADSAITSRDPDRLKAWWIYRMLFGPDPLAERLTLMWHNHFATSNLKVNDLVAMRRQNERFREFARAPFGELLNHVVHDPAILVWLDAQANRREHPNENLARELMELFTLGVGNYSETDVKEAARALTGWTVAANDSVREVADRHDDGQKTILGATGPWRGDDLLRILLEHPATSERLSFRICQLLMGEGSIASSAVRELAAGLRERQLNVGWAVETVLRSEAFFAEANLRNRVLAPIEFLVGSVHVLGLFAAPPSTLLLAEWSARLGQDLFYPPNVFGWPGNRSWITTRSILGRTKFASALIEGSLGSPRLETFEFLPRDADLEAAIDSCSELILGGAPSVELGERLATVPRPAAKADSSAVRLALALILASPEAQLA